MRRTQSIVAALSAVFIAIGLAACGGGIDETDPGDLEFDSQLSFASISVGEEAVETLTLRNVVDSASGGPVTVSNVQLREGNADDFTEFEPVNPDEFPTPQESITIAPGEEVSWEIAFRPENGNADEGEITFQVDNDPDAYDGPRATVDLQTSEMEPEVDISPNSLNYATDSGEVGYKFTLIRNTGQAALDIDSVGLRGSDRFSVVYADPEEVTCAPGEPTFPQVEAGDIDGDGEVEMRTKSLEELAKITPGSQDALWPVDGLQESFAPGECFVAIAKFEPSDNTPESATMVFETNAQPQTRTVRLTGNSDEPCLEIAPSDAVQFGAVTVDRTTTETIRLRNCRPQADALQVSEVEVDNAGGVFEYDPATLDSDLQDSDENSTVSLEGDQQESFVMEATPDQEGSIGSPDCDPEVDPALVVKTNDEANPEKKLCLTVTGDDNQCPSASARCKVAPDGSWANDSIDTLPLETIACDASQSSDPDGTISRYEWTLVNRPEGSSARLTPRSDIPDPSLTTNVAGEYVVELKVYDNEDTVSCGDPERITIEAIPDDDMLGQLTWDTPGDPDETDNSGTDLDLHMVNSDFPTQDADWAWNQSPYDVYWDNPTEDWGIQGDPSDDPQLDRDDRDGAGPENISLDNPKAGKLYKYGVYYYRDNGFGESYATLRIYLQGQLQKEYKNIFLEDADYFWHGADVEWQGSDSRIFTRDIINDNGFPN